VKLVILLATVAVAVTGCDGSKPAGASVDGAEIYQSMCAACHGATGKPDATMIARLNVRDLTSPELRARVSVTLVEQQIREGSANKLMPSLAGAMSDEQIKAVSAYVASAAFPAK
jgi:mono/diheme cytochrome c family protein